jgi:hypothetical protein
MGNEQVGIVAGIGDAGLRALVAAEHRAPPLRTRLIAKVEADDNLRLRRDSAVHAPVQIPHLQIGVGILVAEPCRQPCLPHVARFSTTGNRAGCRTLVPSACRFDPFYI